MPEEPVPITPTRLPEVDRLVRPMTCVVCLAGKVSESGKIRRAGRGKTARSHNHKLGIQFGLIIERHAPPPASLVKLSGHHLGIELDISTQIEAFSHVLCIRTGSQAALKTSRSIAIPVVVPH